MILAIVLSSCLVFFGWTLWKLSRSIHYLLSLSEAQQRNILLGRELTRQVDEIHQTMGGVVNSLRAMGHQVHNLNMLAGHALQGPNAQAMQHNPQIMIEIRPVGGDTPPAPVQPPEEDMPPEMRERLHQFQVLYHRIMTSPRPLPSYGSPDLN